MQEQLHQALSITIEALNNMSCGRYDEACHRQTLYEDTLNIVREILGHEVRLTTMRVCCAWCETQIGEQEGNGAVGDSHGICPTCAEEKLKEA